MLKNISCLLFTLLLNTCLFAQDNSFQGGLVGGPLVSQVSGDGLGGFDKLGYQLGAYVHIPFSKKWAGKIELGYIAKGSQRPGNPDNIGENTWGYRFNYIEVPLLLERQFRKFNIQFGPAIGVLVSSSYVFNKEKFEIVNPEAASTDISFMGGIAYPLSDKFTASMRYSQSLVPVRDYVDVGVNPVFDGGMYNSALHLIVHYRIGAK